MAIKIYERFAPFANPADGDYPYGSIKNDSIPGAEDGTPLDATWGNDYVGFDAALFSEVGIVPNGNPDTVVSSQRLEAIKALNKASTNVISEVVSGYPRQLSSVIKDVVNIKNYGAVDDYDGTTGTNCFTALQAILTEFPDYNVTIRFPNTDTGKYYFNGDLFAADVSGLMLDFDEGVEIYFEGTYIPFLAKGVKVNREVKVRVLNQQYNFYLGREMYGRASDSLIKLTQASGEVCTPSQINPSSGQMYFKSVSWPDNVIVDDTPSTTSTTVDYVSDTNAFNIAMVDAVIGGEAHCYAYAPIYDGKIGVAVFTKEGYSITYQDYNGGVITSGKIVGAGSLSTISKTPTFSTDAYKGVNAQIGIRVHSRRSYSLLINNIDFFKVDDTGSDILSMGFAVGFAPSQPNITLASPTLLKGKKSGGVRPLNIACIGDSTSDENVPPSSFDFMRQYLAGVGGVQVRTLKNLAVSGENSGQQLTRLLSENIAGYDYLLIDVGINDIQGNLGANGLNDNVTAAINYAVANGAVPIVGIPTLWYESSDAAPYGQVGQLSTNAEIGSQYRASLIATVASNNALLNLNTLQDLGVADPSLLAVAEADPVLMDNIHPTNFGRQLRGMGWAKAIIGHAMPDSEDSSPNELVPSSFMVGDAGSSERPFISIRDGVFTISGSASVVTITDGYQVMQLPEGLRPRTNKTVMCSTALAGGVPSGSCTVQVDTSGVVAIYSVPTSTAFVYLDVAFNI